MPSPPPVTAKSRTTHNTQTKRPDHVRAATSVNHFPQRRTTTTTATPHNNNTIYCDVLGGHTHSRLTHATDCTQHSCSLSHHPPPALPNLMACRTPPRRLVQTTRAFAATTINVSLPAPNRRKPPGRPSPKLLPLSLMPPFTHPEYSLSRPPTALCTQSAYVKATASCAPHSDDTSKAVRVSCVHDISPHGGLGHPPRPPRIAMCALT
jgi:hypothetical protein